MLLFLITIKILTGLLVAGGPLGLGDPKSRSDEDDDEVLGRLALVSHLYAPGGVSPVTVSSLTGSLNNSGD